MFLGLMIRSKPCKQSQQKSTRVDWAERFFSVSLVRCNPGVVALHGWLNHHPSETSIFLLFCLFIHNLSLTLIQIFSRAWHMYLYTKCVAAEGFSSRIKQRRERRETWTRAKVRHASTVFWFGCTHLPAWTSKIGGQSMLNLHTE
jgi:hypothetical protein